MRTTFLHLSDLHLRTDWPEETARVCDRLIADLRVQVPLYENPFVAFSGDLVHSGENDASYAEFLRRFDSALSDVGLPRSRRFVVPGNHDVSRRALGDSIAFLPSALDALRDEEAFNNALPRLERSFLSEHFAHYRSTEVAFAEYGALGSSLGGAGWCPTDDLAVYCLNTALCSMGGLDKRGDLGRLAIDSRTLHRWIADTRDRTRVLIMHHPLEWLTPWASRELTTLIATEFALILHGHLHDADATISSAGSDGRVRCIAPALFTRKSETLGYAFITIDTATQDVRVSYRQWVPAQHVFVSGTVLAAHDSGTRSFNYGQSRASESPRSASVTALASTRDILQAEFDSAATFFSKKKRFWVQREVANIRETAHDRADATVISGDQFAQAPVSCTVRAPTQFGLSAFGRYVALEHHEHAASGKTLLLLSSSSMPGHRNGVLEAIDARCATLKIAREDVAGVIVDDWSPDNRNLRSLNELRNAFPRLPIVLLQSVDDSLEIASGLATETIDGFQSLWLWSLSRQRVRELVLQYISTLEALDEDLVTNKVLADIDALNIHRTPMNCLLILKLLEQSFDDSPVNRTEMIGRVLFLLFHQFDNIPRYATRPDLKDCEYALGFLAERLIRAEKSNFTKPEFFSTIGEYCALKVIDLDVDVLFSFLTAESILVKRGGHYEFRFSYWLYFFAAHRMHHDAAFADYVLTDCRYSAMPEVIEFYTGIDRRRADAVERLTSDLRRLNEAFTTRTGIPSTFNPLEHAHWRPDKASLQLLKQQVEDRAADSALPKAVKDAIADRGYDPAGPYRQELAQFLKEASLKQLVLTMRGAARALRNSDHVGPDAKDALLGQVMETWRRVAQVLFVVSPLLAQRRTASFEGMGFVLDKSFDGDRSDEARWEMIITSIADNVVTWYQEDVFSKRMGALFGKHIGANHGTLEELFLLLVSVRQRQPGWERMVEEFVIRSPKNAFSLNRVFSNLVTQYRTSFSTERTRADLRRLAAMSIAKHETGSKHPNRKLIEKAAKAIDEKERSSPDR